MTGDTTISESEVLRRLQEVTVLDNGRSDEQERDDGIYEVAWWDIPPEDAETLADLTQYENVGVGVKNASRGPDMDDTVRLSVATCIIPAPPDEVAEQEWEHYEEEREDCLRERYEDDN